MCGIVTIVFDRAIIVPEIVENMTASLRHRGPDAMECVRLEGCHLGHTRLSVIDLVSGDQPMTEETERYWIVFNGEIYNYRELRRELEGLGWQFRTQSDTEVLLRAYQEYGERAPEHLNGQFAFAIWDQAEKKLFAARDRLGEKPLYWARSDDGALLLASEIKAILASGLVQPRLDLMSVDAYLGLLYVLPDRTIYENVHTLRPAHAAVWQEGRMRQWAYWQPSYSHIDVSDRKALNARLRDLIDQAVRRQMVADVPVGAFLSGGLDSSTIAALMTRYTSQPLMTFTVGFGDLINEIPYAQAVAQAYRTDHHEIQMNIPVGEMLERMAVVYDEPFGDSSNIPTYLMSEFARQRVKVVLSGDGGDEVFGGYEWYLPLLSVRHEEDRPVDIPWLQATSLGWRILVKAGLPFREQRDTSLQGLADAVAKRRYPDVWERHLARFTDLKRDHSLLWGDRPVTGLEAALRQTYRPGDDVRGLGNRATDFDLKCYLPGDILVKVDRAAMAHGLETRAPFLDVDLVEFVLGLPWELRFRGPRLKSLLRESCSDLWPEPVRQRPKQGFGAPIAYWLRRPDVQDLLRRVCAPDSSLLALLPGAAASLPQLGPQQQWTLLCLGLWLERRSECLNNLA